MKHAALKTLLESDPRYAAALAKGSNGRVVAMLNATDPAGAKRWRPVRVDDFLDALAGETLTPAQEDRIRTYTAQREYVPVHKAGVRTWLGAQGFASSTIAALRALAERDGRYCDPVLDDDDDVVALADVRKAARQIAVHGINTYEAAARAATTARRQRMAALAQADAAWLAANPAKDWTDHPILRATDGANAEMKANV